MNIAPLQILFGKLNSNLNLNDSLIKVFNETGLRTGVPLILRTVKMCDLIIIVIGRVVLISTFARAGFAHGIVQLPTHSCH